jgi:hypothetical protein
MRANLTSTPASKAECPKVTSSQNADHDFLQFPFDNQGIRRNLQENILDFLNQYGAQALYKSAKYIRGWEDIVLQDLTNDGVPELAIRANSFYIFGCHGGKYEKLFELEPDIYLHPPSITTLRDANRNGIPELTLLLGYVSDGGHYYGIYEWNGKEFANLIDTVNPFYPDSGSIWVEATGKIHYEDIYHDSYQELVADSGIPVWESYPAGLPWRNERSIYKWNGVNFVVSHREFAASEFRFQAIQDADLAFSQQEYAKALDLYQQAIFNNELKVFSQEIRQNLQANYYTDLNKKPTVTPVPDDPTEYPRLAAYAYYRMIILHTFLGEIDAAQVKYASLQEKFPANNLGHPYAEMASAFWDVYKSSGNMAEACGAAIAYSSAHTAIFVPLGGSDHGAQSYEYGPVDMCPYK